MSTYSTINGIQRKNKSYVKVNGVWRKSNTYVNINGVFRNISNDNIKNKIKSFKIIYRLIKNPIHKDFPNLTYNENLPIIINLAGSKELDYKPKSIFFKYTNKKNKEEGICLYEGKLYAILDNEEIMFDENILNNFNIWIRAYSSYQCYGYNVFGWNNIFNKNTFLDYTDIKSFDERAIKYVDKYYLYPKYKRDLSFDNISRIGICRDMKSENKNMISSKGYLDHTYEKICIDDIEYPFILEIKN